MGDAGDAPPSKSTNLFLQIVEHPDGTVTRPFVPSSPPVSAAPDSPDGIVALSRDVPLNASRSTSLRLYLPSRHAADDAKLPVVLFFHGGGFVLFSNSSIFYHASCEAMAGALDALVVSVEYRLAPEHRLPAAYDDADDALRWLHDQAVLAASFAGGDPWVTAHGDLARCFLMGSSSGGNICYHAALRAARADDPLPVKVTGVILNQPYLGGVDRTPSEVKSEDDFMLPLEANDMLWRLSLPIGADRDHEFSNPSVAGAPKPSGLPPCLLIGCEGDPLFDRQREFAAWLEMEGVEITSKLDGEPGFHAIELFVPPRAEALFATVGEFIVSASRSAADAI